MRTKNIIILVSVLVLLGLLAMGASATVNLLAPDNYEWVNYNMSAGLNFTYNYTGSQATVNCTLWIDGLAANLSYAINNNTLFNASNSSFAIASGAHNWNVTCTNVTRTAGYSYSDNSTTYVVNYDPSTPTVYLNSPIDYAVNNTANITASFSFIDAYSQNASCVLSLNGAALTTNATTQNNTNTTIFGVATNGTKIWQINCTDLADNLGASSTRTYYEDTVAPSVYLVKPADTNWNNTGNISVVFSFIDPAALNTSCSLYLNGVS
ncbi:hypothetical protein HZC32_01580, partial [Candidatus Woesearchaeota archaeon]|nr:hypothetical protein [Candidatus Woesearchaeota archaeon]